MLCHENHEPPNARIGRSTTAIGLKFTKTPLNQLVQTIHAGLGLYQTTAHTAPGLPAFDADD